jgi:hypothetical protein
LVFEERFLEMADVNTSPRRDSPPDEILNDFVQLMELLKLPDEGNMIKNKVK